MLAVLRINNIVVDRAATELTAKLGGSFQEVRRDLGKRAVVFMSFTPFLRNSSIKSSLIIVLLLGAFRTFAHFNGDRVRIDHVVIQAVQGAVALIGVLMLVIALACGYFLVTIRTKHHSSLQR